ncbi:TPA: hypothetical protein DD448_02245 [Candidatus Collierbacteria bacterium]|nr:hypothetical protein [Candidatus Collierbacteria bacterium]HBO10745.1 hypothetical protein [Candidatus Collierbacteria bacterium]
MPDLAGLVSLGGAGVTGGSGAAGGASEIFASTSTAGFGFATNASGVSSFIFIGGLFVGGTGAGVDGKRGGVGIVGVPRGGGVTGTTGGTTGGVTGSVLPNAASTAA